MPCLAAMLRWRCPFAPGPAPVLHASQNELHNYRKSLIALTSTSGLAGVPQVCVL